MSQKSIITFFRPTSELLQMICRSQPTITPDPKRRIGRPRIAPVCADSRPTDLVKIPADPVVPPAGCVVSSTDSIVPHDPVAPPTSPVVPHAGPSTSIEKAPGNKMIRSRHSFAQKKKLAQYARSWG